MDHSEAARALFGRATTAPRAVFAAFCDETAWIWRRRCAFLSFGGGMGRLREVSAR
jgi:hypothetical protein